MTCRRLLGILAAIEMARKTPPLELSRSQILCFRRRVGSLTNACRQGRSRSALPRGPACRTRCRGPRCCRSTRAWRALIQPAGSTRPWSSSGVRGTAITSWPRRTSPLFSLGRLPEDPRRRARAQDTAARLHAFLDGRRMPFGQAGRAMGVSPNSLRYAAPTGTVLLRWDGSRQPVVWTVPPPDMDPWQARLELARRYLHVFGPATPACSPAGPGSESRGEARRSKGSRVR